MTTRLLPRLLAVLMPMALLALPVVAHAEKVVTEDSAGDVQLLDFGSDEDLQPAPDYVASDITRTAAAYGTTRLRVTVHFRDLLNTALLRTEVRVRTPEGPYFLTTVRVPGKRVRTTFGRPQEGDLECRGVAGRFDGVGDTVTISVPAACIGSPRWVQLAVTAIGAEEASLDADELVLHLDDAHRDAIRPHSMATGPRLHRG